MASAPPKCEVNFVFAWCSQGEGGDRHAARTSQEANLVRELARDEAESETYADNGDDPRNPVTIP